MNKKLRIQGFTLVEMTLGLVIIGIVLLAFAGIMNVMQKSSASTSEYASAQQNARVALDFITENLRAAGSDVEAYNGQPTIAHADPYQVVFNGDFDRGQTIQGEAPLGAIEATQNPHTYPPTGTPLYSPTRSYSSGAETIAFTLDSDQDGFVTGADRGDDDEEDIPNPHLYVLKRYVEGYENGASNNIRESNISLVRGPVAYRDGTLPPPLFEYYYNDDNDKTTPDKLWGDDSPEDGKIEGGEISSLVPVPDSLLHAIRRIKVNVVSEAMRNNPEYPNNDGFVEVRMSSQVYVRNVDIREASLVFGTVWYDANGNGVKDSGEPGMPKVAVELDGSGRRTVTDAFGNYSIPVSAGTFNVVETDPTGYTSSTANTVNITLEPGEKKTVNFGDTSTYQFGYLSGTVYEDDSEDGIKDWNEAGIPGVTITLSNDMAVKTSDSGYYRFTVPLGTYTVTEEDLPGFASTTANAVEATLASQGDSVVTNYGDIPGPAYGTLRGWVYLDDDEDGQRDFGESGLENVSISLSSGDATYTDASGYYEFQLDPGKYDVYELDSDGMTSSTPNLVEDVVMAVDSTVTVNFGDMPIKDVDFIEIFVGDTDRPLSVSATDVSEDLNRDIDIVLGTPTSVGPGNLFLFINKWASSSTPLTELFDSSPTYTRSALGDVNALRTYDFQGDLHNDVLTGLGSTSENMQLWINENKGDLKNAPDVAWTAGYQASVTSMRLADLNNDGLVDIVAGLTGGSGPNTGGFEVFMGMGNGAYSSALRINTWGGGSEIGSVSDLDLADMDGDGDLDVVVASNSGPYWGAIDVFQNDYYGYKFTWRGHYLAKAGVNEVDAVELYDKLGGTDILVGVSEAPAVGGVHVWFNHDGRFGKPDSSGFDYDKYVVPNVPDEYINAGGEGLVVKTRSLDGDIFKEILIGTRSSLFYTGDLFLVRRTSSTTDVTNLKVNIAGEVVALDFADFNRDDLPDIVTTTRTSNSSGKLAVYFLDSGTIAP
jgi:prepilin-type N-terminal cleavage/methylation domain-containing protein